MKKLLLASTALMAGAVAAAADTGVTISGYGRFGLVYDSSATSPVKKTQIHTRLRFNIDAKTETDSGVVFGGRIRLQHTNGDVSFNKVTLTPTPTPTPTTTTVAVTPLSGARLSPALLYVTYEGLRVEVGNANGAFDSAALLYDSELGLVDSSGGDSRSSFYSFATGPYDVNRMGVFASYSMSGFSGKISYITPDQTTSAGVVEESSIALSYENDMFVVSAAAAQDAAGIANNDIWFIGAAYKGLPNTTIGLNYIDEGLDSAGGLSLGKTAVLYANYTMDAWTFKGYIAHNDYVNNLTDTVGGIGADYDLGGAKLTGGIQRTYDKETYADFGVRFDF
jgi:outer membrane protein OmpU